jgi:hypothetical protein
VHPLVLKDEYEYEDIDIDEPKPINIVVKGYEDYILHNPYLGLSQK